MKRATWSHPALESGYRPVCPDCGATERQNRSGVTAAGSQRFKCKLCGKQYTPRPAQRESDDADWRAMLSRVNPPAVPRVHRPWQRND